MAHPYFEGLGVSLDGHQTALAVQSLLESQSTSTEPDDGDIFQCGRCKKQFTLLPDFITHKDKCKPNTPAVPKAVRPLQAIGGQASAFTPTLSHILGKQQTIGLASVAPAPLSQNLVLSEDLMTLPAVDGSNLSLQPQQYNITFQNGNSVLSQVATTQVPLQPLVSVAPTFSGTVASLASSNSAFTSTIASSGLSAPGTNLPQEQEVEISTGNAVKTAVPQAEGYAPGTDIPEALPTITICPTPELGQSGSSQAVESLSVSGAPAIGSVSLATVEGLTLAGGLQLQQIQLTGSQAQSVVLTSGLNSSDANLLQGVSLLKPNVAKLVEAKKDGYALLQPQELQLITSSATEPSAETNIQSPTKVGKLREKVEKVVQDDGGNKKKLRCTYCDKPFTKNFDLQQHMRSHTGEKPFQCIVCGRAFAQKSNVKKHMQTHKVWPMANMTLPAQPLVTASGVSSTNASEVGVSKEMEASADGDSQVIYIDNSYRCQYCDKKFPNYFKLKTHLVEHKSEQVYKCIHEKCSETFKELDHYLEHVKTHESDMEYKCHVCSKKFPSLYDLGVHQYSHSLYPNQGTKTGSKKLFKCSLCGSRYASSSSLKHHLETTKHKYPCPAAGCHKVFYSERFLRRHILIHNDSNFECSICGKTFRTEHYLKIHMQNHSTDTPFKCDICGAAFNRKDKLRRHRLIHDSTKKFKCPFRNHTGCDKEFNRSDKLKSHIITHSGIKPFKCRYCSKVFGRRPALMEHVRVHEGNYRFSCPSCKKGFNRKSLLEHHVSICTGKEDIKSGTELECIKNSTAAKKKFTQRPVKRKPGRPRKMININEMTETLNQVKRPVGRPRKILPTPNAMPAGGEKKGPNDSGIDVRNATVGDGNGERILLISPDDTPGMITEPLKTFAETQNMGELSQDGSTVLHVQLVTDDGSPMLSQALDHVPLKTESVQNIEMVNPSAINISGSLTQDQLQEIFLTGNAHNVKLMEALNGETFVIDETSQSIIAQIAPSGAKGDASHSEKDTKYQPTNDGELSIESTAAGSDTTITSVPLSSEGGEDDSFVTYVVAAVAENEDCKPIDKL